MTDDGGVLGNLPNSRPGKRSAKRDASAKRAANPRKRAAPTRTAATKVDPVPPPPSEDPVGAVVRTATGVAVTGVRVAGAVGREFFKRLPRP
jgi:hypothetical protein